MKHKLSNELSVEQLNKILEELKLERMRAECAIRGDPRTGMTRDRGMKNKGNPYDIRKIKREIARCKTLIREKQSDTQHQANMLYDQL